MRSWQIFPIILVGLLLISCGGAKPAPTPVPPPTPPAAPATLVVDASKLYANKCAVCHGANRQSISGLGPALTPQSLAARTNTEIKDVITNGKPNTAMTAWKGILTPEEIEALVQFVKTTSP